MTSRLRTTGWVALLAALLTACAGPRADLPSYDTNASAPAAPAPSADRPAPSGPFDEAAARERLGIIAARLTDATRDPAMCARVDCPEGPYVVEVIDSDAVNAATDGRNIYVARGLIEFVGSDGELAAVMAHEIAHGLLDHRSSKEQDVLTGALLGAAVSAAVGTDVTNLGANIGALSYSKQYEREADYVGMYLLARAGYPLRDAYTMWQRMNAQGGGAGGGFLATHPAFSERLALIRATNDEIAAKIERNQPLLPAVQS